MSLDALRNRLTGLDRLVVAFSGGVDSALLARVSHDVLGARSVAVTAVSGSLAPSELDDCRRFAADWGMRWLEVGTDELARPGYVANGIDRCYHCKSELMDRLAPVAEGEGGAPIALGVNLDDLDDHRPGQRAARERGALFPLVETGFTKAMVRDAAHRLGLEAWDKPAAACLASRIPYGTPVTVGTLHQVARAEAALKRGRVSASFGSATTATWPASSCGRARPGGGGTPPPGHHRCRERDRVPLCDSGSGRVPQRQPERRARAMSERVRLTFPVDLVRRPVIGELVRRFDVLPNIRRADVSDDVGWIVCELDGDPAAVSAAVAWMVEIGVDVDRLDHPLES